MKRDRIKGILRSYGSSIFLTALLLVVLQGFLSHHINLLFSFVNIVFVFAVLALVGKVRSKVVSTILTVFVALLLSAGVSFAVLFSVPLTLGNLASIAETNFSEIIAFSPFVFAIVGICLLCTTILCLKAKNELKRRFSAKVSGVVLIALVLFVNLVAVAIPVYRNSSFFSIYKKDLREMPLQTIYTFSSMRLPLLYGDILGIAVYLHEKIEFESFKNAEKKIPSGLSLSSTPKKIQTIYLVVGESAYRKRMSLYGYPVKTTPFLDSLAQADSSSIHFYNAIAIANITRDAVRFSLSFASPFNKDAFWKEKNSIELASNAGYQTAWLSNQDRAGLYDNYPSYIACSSERSYFESKIYKEDLDLLSHLDSYHQREGNQLIALHLMGSHFPFSYRYDALDDAYFANSKQVSEYDKSIHHTDRLLQSLYDYTLKKDTSSIIIYFSDHGASPSRGVHGLKHANISEYEIPLVVLTHNVNVDVDSIVSRYRSADLGVINNLNLSYILAEMMGYTVDDHIVQKARQEGDNVVLVDGQTCSFSFLEHISR